MRLRERFFSRWRNANKIGIFFYYGGIKKYFIVEAGTRRRKTAAGPAIWSTSLAIWIVSLLFFFHFFHLIFLSSFFCLFLSFSFSFVFVASGNEMESGSRAWNGCCCCCCCSCCNCQKLSARAGRQIGQRLAVVTHFPCVARFYFSAARRRCLRDSRHFTVLFEMVLRRVDRTRPGFTGFTCLLSLFLLFFFRFYKILLGMLSHRIWA